jgi:hypothetical protein
LKEGKHSQVEEVSKESSSDTLCLSELASYIPAKDDSSPQRISPNTSYSDKEEDSEEEIDLTSIETDFELTNSLLSYDKFYPGRVLGNTFTLRN